MLSDKRNGACGLEVSKHFFKQKIGGGFEHLQLAPSDVQPSGGESGTPVITDKPAAEPGYHNPSTLVWLIGYSNEAMAVVERAKMMELVDAGSQVSTLTKGLFLESGLKDSSSEDLLCLEGTWGISIPYKGYSDDNLIIPGLPPV